MDSGQGGMRPRSRVALGRPSIDAGAITERRPKVLVEGEGQTADEVVHDTVDLGPPRDLADATDISPATASPEVARLPAYIQNLGRVFADGARLKARDYRIESRIGKGGFAEVYCAVHEPSGARAALKVLNVLQVSEEISVERFKREGNLLASLCGDDGFPQFLEMFEEPGAGVVLVMELLRGYTLRAHLKKRLGAIEALTIVKRAARHVAILHAKSIVHRDLKPENIILEPGPGLPADGECLDMRVVILDLGIAKMRGGPVTSSSSLVGTWQYVSPEHLGRGEICPASDVYALAVMLYEMIEGQHPYTHLAREASGGAQAAFHVLHAPKLPERMALSVWNRIVCPALQKDPLRRTPTALDLAAAIEAWLADHDAGRLTRDDYEAACDAGDAAMPPPQALRREEGRVSDRPPTEIPCSESAASPSLLVVAPPALAGKRYAIGRSLTLGRLLPTEDPTLVEADLTFPVETVSGKHCQLEISAEEALRCTYTVRDWKSRNGTRIDGVPVRDGYLRPLQILRLGDVELMLLEPGPAPPNALERTATPTPKPAVLAAAPIRPRTQRASDVVFDTTEPSARGPSPRARNGSALVWVVGLVVITLAVCTTALVIAFRSPGAKPTALPLGAAPPATTVPESPAVAPSLLSPAPPAASAASPSSASALAASASLAPPAQGWQPSPPGRPVHPLPFRLPPDAAPTTPPQPTPTPPQPTPAAPAPTGPTAAQPTPPSSWEPTWKRISP